jgi:hypothetical protein
MLLSSTGSSSWSLSFTLSQRKPVYSKCRKFKRVKALLSFLFYVPFLQTPSVYSTNTNVWHTSQFVQIDSKASPKRRFLQFIHNLIIIKHKDQHEIPVTAFIHRKNTANITACLECYRHPRLSYLKNIKQDKAARLPLCIFFHNSR